MDLESLLSGSRLLNNVIDKIQGWADYFSNIDVVVTALALFVLYKAIKEF